MAIAVTFAVALLPAVATATHDSTAEMEICTGETYEGTFVCGLLLVNMLPDVPIEPVFIACPPAPTFVSDPIISDSFDSPGHAVYDLHVPVGSEIALRNCYLDQPGVANAVLGGTGELTPSTAVSASNPAAPRLVLGLLLLVIAGLMLFRSSLARHTARR